MASTYKSILLSTRPSGPINPSEQFKLSTSPRPSASSLKENQVLVENLYLSLDPAMRGWMNDTRSYIPPVALGAVMRGGTISRVLESTADRFKPGDYVSCTGGWAELSVLPAKDLVPIEVPSGGKLTDALGPLGLTGLTAYFGLLDVGKVKEGETVVVSGAAGATGSVVCQIAKIKGCRVIGIAGGDEKVAWLKELGCAEALNYKDKEFASKFREATKEYIDVFFDNVGGEILDLALSRAKPHARFVICGGISQYNSTEPRGPKNFMNVIAMRIRMQGFIVFDYAKQYPEARAQLAAWLSSGQLQRKEHIIKGGLEAAPEGLVGLYQGANTGKMIVEIKAPEEGAKL